MAKSFYTIVIIFVAAARCCLFPLFIRCDVFILILLELMRMQSEKWKQHWMFSLFIDMRVHSSVVKDERITSSSSPSHITIVGDVVVLAIINHNIIHHFHQHCTMEICSRLFWSNFAFFNSFFSLVFCGR